MTATKETLAYEVAELLSLPHDSRLSCKAYEIVTVIVNAMTRALQNGDAIKIEGFGILMPRLSAPHRHSYCPVASNLFTKYPNLYQEVKTFPGKTRIVFKPAKPLLRYINEES